MAKVKIGIVGFGVVGQAIGEGFMIKGHEVFANDPRWEVDTWKGVKITTKKEIVKECEVIFICVDTPSLPSGHPGGEGGCDLSKVYQAFNDCWLTWGNLSRTEEGVGSPVYAIKSTVIPGTVDTLIEGYPLVCSNPEFLRQKTPLEDFMNQDRIIIGSSKEEITKKMLKVYEGFDCPKIVVKPAEAELIKYLSNTMLITKVAFSQEISRISSMLDLDAMKVYEGIVADKRISPYHLNPSEGRISLFTPCLAKDMLALINQLDRSGYETNFMKTAYAKAVDGVKINFKLEVTK